MIIKLILTAILFFFIIKEIRKSYRKIKHRTFEQIKYGNSYKA